MKLTSITIPPVVEKVNILNLLLLAECFRKLLLSTLKCNDQVSLYSVLLRWL